jgi:hypothetical protein
MRKFAILAIALILFTSVNALSKFSNNLEPAVQDIALGYLKAEPLTQEEITANNVNRRTEPYSLVFDNVQYTPDPSVKLDSEISSVIDVTGKPYFYGFIMVNDSIDKEKLKIIEQEGTVFLGYHTYHSILAKIPLSDLSRLQTLPFVRWVGVNRQNQKMTPGLYEMIKTKADLSEKVKVYITPFRGAESDLENYLKSIEVNSLTYLPIISAYHAEIPLASISNMANRNEVVYVELDLEHGQPTMNLASSAVSADYFRGNINLDGNPLRYDGRNVSVGIIDLDYNNTFPDLPNYTNSLCPNGVCASAAYVQSNQSHGTFVASILLGRGNLSNQKYLGIAPGISNLTFALYQSDNHSLAYYIGWISNTTPYPTLVSISDTAGLLSGVCGTDPVSRALDNATYFQNQTYVISAANNGPAFQTINYAPNCAKNAITVGSILDNGNNSGDTIDNESSRGFTPDNRTKPDISAPGYLITAANSTTGGYTTDSGTSFAAPAVAGVVATLMDHYPWLKGNASAVKALLMMSAIPLNSTKIDLSQTVGRDFMNTFGAGKVDSVLAHFQANDPTGWQSGLLFGNVSGGSGAFRYNLTLPSGVKRLVVVLAWSEKAADVGNSKAVWNDIGLYVDPGATGGLCQTGTNDSVQSFDNKQYVAIDNPPSGTTELKACTFSTTPDTMGNLVIGYMIIRGELRPEVVLHSTANVSVITVGKPFEITTSANTQQYMSSSVFMDFVPPAGVSVLGMRVTRQDAVTVTYGPGNTSINLGDIKYGGGFNIRSATWILNATTNGTKTYTTYINPSNGRLTATSINLSDQYGAPTITLSEPSVPYVTGAPTDIYYGASDPTNLTLSISCYGDSTNSSFNKNQTCFSDTPNDGAGNCDIRSWPVGKYYIWCSANNSYLTSKNYSTGYLYVWRLNLTKGWNLASFMVLPTNANITGVLSPINENYTKIQTYNATQGKWLTYDTSVSSSFQTLSKFSIGEGYWILMNVNATFMTDNGFRPTSTTLQFPHGWNMFAYPYEGRATSDALANLSSNFTKVQAYNQSSGKWLTYDPTLDSTFNTLKRMEAGIGYWIYVNSTVTSELRLSE